jgi:hypothetical protein
MSLIIGWLKQEQHAPLPPLHCLRICLGRSPSACMWMQTHAAMHVPDVATAVVRPCPLSAQGALCLQYKLLETRVDREWVRHLHIHCGEHACARRSQQLHGGGEKWVVAQRIVCAETVHGLTDDESHTLSTHVDQLTQQVSLLKPVRTIRCRVMWFGDVKTTTIQLPLCEIKLRGHIAMPRIARTRNASTYIPLAAR